MRSINDGAYKRAIDSKTAVMFFVSQFQAEPISILPSAEGKEGTLPDPEQFNLNANIIIGVPVREEVDSEKNLWIVFEEVTEIPVQVASDEDAPDTEKTIKYQQIKFENRLNQAHIVYSVMNVPIDG